MVIVHFWGKVRDHRSRKWSAKLAVEGVCVSKAEVSMGHLIRVFTKPEQLNSKLAQIEQHIS
ncbi:MAG: hypothetical protein ACPH9N_07385, partial [Alteromonas sp.]